MNLHRDPRPAMFSTFASTVGNVRSQDANGVFYFGGGLEGHIGPVGLRLHAGGEMYCNNEYTTTAAWRPARSYGSEPFGSRGPALREAQDPASV
jgi:hypothetical protein